MSSRTTVAVLLAALAACAGSHAERRGSQIVGQRLSLSAPGLDGHMVDVAEQAGKVRVVDFWATWCEPCKDAMPVLDRMAREFAERGLLVYGLSIDEDPALVVEYLRQRPVAFPILLDKDAVRLNALGVSFMPVTLLVDRRGTIRYVHQGWDERRERLEREEVESLLREP